VNCQTAIPKTILYFSNVTVPLVAYLYLQI
jgi:hypothetical protein